jgi:hypothetical protein
MKAYRQVKKLFIIKYLIESILKIYLTLTFIINLDHSSLAELQEFVNK